MFVTPKSCVMIKADLQAIETRFYVRFFKRSSLCFAVSWIIEPSKAYLSRDVPRVQYSTTVRSAHTVYLCVLCGSENKQRLFPYTALTDWFV